MPCDRELRYLMPQSWQDWLPEDDLAWFILDAVAQMNLSATLGPLAPMGGARLRGPVEPASQGWDTGSGSRGDRQVCVGTDTSWYAEAPLRA